MDLRRLRVGEVVAAVSGAVLILSLTLPWYGHELRSPLFQEVALDDQSAFAAMAIADAFLLAVGLAALALLLVTATQKTVAVPIAYVSLFTIAALVAAAVVVAHLGMEPDPAQPLPPESERSVQTSTAFGAYLAFLGSLGMIAGGLVAMRDERLSRPGRPTDSTGRPSPPPPEIEPLPAPPSETARR